MKNVLAGVIFAVLFGGAFYFGLPFLIEKETAGLRSEVHDLSQKLRKAEEFITSEEEARKVTQLMPDADAQRIIKAVNTLSLKLMSLENSSNEGLSATGEELKRHKVATDETFKKQADMVDKIGKDAEEKIKKNTLIASMAAIRGQVLKVKVDLLSKNIGTAKSELGIIVESLEKVKAMAHDEDKKAIGELQSSLKKAIAEADTDLPAATGRVDILWHELSKRLKDI